MPTAEKLSLKVNGQQYERVTLRLKMEDGYPGGPPEVVIPDDFLGPMVLTDEFQIELQEDGKEFTPVALPYLIGMLEAYRD
jgi:hypothetical protein